MLIAVAIAYLMVSTWRFYSFKDIDFRSRQPFRLIILFALLVCRHLVFLPAVAVHHSRSPTWFRACLAPAVDFPPPRQSAAALLIKRHRRPHEFELQIAGRVSRRPHARRQLLSGGHCRRRHRSRARKSPRSSATATFPRWMSSCWTTTNPWANSRPWATKSLSSRSVRAEQFAQHRLHLLRRRSRIRPQELEDGPQRRQRHRRSDLRSGRRTRCRSCARPGSSASWDSPCFHELQPGPVVTAHPASVVLALLMLRVQKAAKVERAAATVFEPASRARPKGHG